MTLLYSNFNAKLHKNPYFGYIMSSNKQKVEYQVSRWDPHPSCPGCRQIIICLWLSWKFASQCCFPPGRGSTQQNHWHLYYLSKSVCDGAIMINNLVSLTVTWWWKVFVIIMVVGVLYHNGSYIFKKIYWEQTGYDRITAGFEHNVYIVLALYTHIQLWLRYFWWNIGIHLMA